MTKYRITAKVPTVYQLSSLRTFGMEVINLPTGAYYSEQDFDTIEEARQYMIDRATHYYDWDEEALESAIDGIINHSMLTMDACTGRIDEVEEEEEEVEMSAEDMEEERGIDMLEDDRQSNW